MSGTLEKVLCLRNNTIFKQAFSLLRFRTSGEKSLCSVAQEEEGKSGSERH
ncbi:MRPL48 isoform 3 [Pongo abelii]|uniref:MRPL48 isoform 3 n=1 Tax=Pongo abelii TaxID=9601 RepID=A0A2J8V1I7_PONAB|nr:MRPL48 isoform 3 [Pongo abelii]